MLHYGATMKNILFSTLFATYLGLLGKRSLL